MLHDSKYTSEEYRKIGNDNYEFYRHILADNDMDVDTKNKHMNDWWEADMSGLVKQGITKDQFLEMTQTSNLFFRHGIKQLFEIKTKHEVPFLVVSAGIGEVVKSAFELYFNEQSIDESVLKPFSILSNLGIYDENNVLVDFNRPLVTAMNKDDHVHNRFEEQKHSDEESGHHTRDNIIMLGDITQDVKMIDKVKYVNAIKIGYLNHKQNLENEKYLESFKEHYDIIVTFDGNLDIVNQILLLASGTSLEELEIKDQTITDLFKLAIDGS